MTPPARRSAALWRGSSPRANARRSIVIHENRGLNPHIQDVARRIALEGFLALAVDMLSPLGGTPADEDKARDMIGTLNADETARRIAAAVPFLEQHRGIDRQGRRRRLLLGRRHGQPHRGAGARSEGRRCLLRAQPPAEQVTIDPAPLLLHYAGLDQRVNAGIPAYEAALKANDKRYTIHVYPNVNHAFNNDTSNRYDKPAADLAWNRSIAFFKENLGVPPA